MKDWAWRSLILAALATVAPAWADAGVEAKIKAAYLFNFTRFAEWPSLQASPNAPLRICVLGSETMARLLGELRNRDVNGHPLHVESGPEYDERKSGCHVLFIDRSVAARFLTQSEQWGRSEVLTVSDMPQFAQKAGVIGFVTDGGRVRIEINPRRARESRVNLSAKLLEVATLVD